MHASRIADIRLLNKQRWAAHVAAREQQGVPLEPRPTAPTAGALFNRPNPLNADHSAFVNPYVRSEDRFVEKRGEVMFMDPSGKVHTFRPEKSERLVRDWRSPEQNPSRYVPVYGHDFTSLSARSHGKYRIPATSVVNKVGDLKLFCCVGWRLTAAQWIWWTNLFCFVAHTFMVFLTLHMAYWRWDRNPFTDTEHVTVYIYRVTQVPTPEMIANNETRWSPGWNLTNPRDSGGNEWYVRENGMPVNFATLTLSFFLISALFHLWACVVGLFERFWFIYWRQMDDAFCWWRWLEYSASASIMAMAIAISIGIREQSVLASIFMLHFTTMCYGFLTEYISVPKAMVDTTNYQYPIGPLQVAEFAKAGRLASDIAPYGDGGNTDYRRDPRALKLISQDQWELERPVYDIQDTAKALGKESDYFVQAQRTNNYVRRMVPHVLGYFPMTAAWVIMITHLEQARYDLTLITDRTIPEWVDGAIYGTVIIFWSFTLVQIVYQYMPPGFYWGSELIYCVLSLSAKLYLGFFLLINVIMTDGTVEQSLAPAEGA